MICLPEFLCPCQAPQSAGPETYEALKAIGTEIFQSSKAYLRILSFCDSTRHLVGIPELCSSCLAYYQKLNYMVQSPSSISCLRGKVLMSNGIHVLLLLVVDLLPDKRISSFILPSLCLFDSSAAVSYFIQTRSCTWKFCLSILRLVLPLHRLRCGFLSPRMLLALVNLAHTALWITPKRLCGYERFPRSIPICSNKYASRIIFRLNNSRRIIMLSLAIIKFNREILFPPIFRHVDIAELHSIMVLLRVSFTKTALPQCGAD